MKKTLIICGMSVLTIMAVGQKNNKVLNSKSIADLKKHIYLSASKDPLAITKFKTISSKELNAKQLVAPKNTGRFTVKAAPVASPLVDTAFTYPWDAASQQWDTMPVARVISHYDAWHNLIHYLASAWNYDIKDWQDSVQFFYKYNKANQVLNVFQQSWQFDGISSYSWVNIDNCITGYNDLGQESKFNYQYWSYDTNDWGDIWQHDFTYDSNGNNTLIVESYWDGMEWIPGMNFIYKYDSLNHVTLNPIQVWDYNINDWSDAFQYLYDYDKLGNNISMLLQTWNPDEGAWDNCVLQTINYNSSNKIDNYLFQFWDPSLLDWNDFERAYYKYDSTGNNTSIIGEDYDPYSDTWTTSWENTYDYNSKNKQVSSASLYWDSGFGNWFSGSKTKNLRINKFKFTDVKQPVANSLEVYPNPASEFVNLRNSSDITSVQMFDISGRVVMLRSFNGLNSVQLGVSNLKSGAYILYIKDAQGNSFTKRIIKR